MSLTLTLTLTLPLIRTRTRTLPLTPHYQKSCISERGQVIVVSSLGGIRFSTWLG